MIFVLVLRFKSKLWHIFCLLTKCSADGLGSFCFVFFFSIIEVFCFLCIPYLVNGLAKKSQFYIFFPLIYFRFWVVWVSNSCECMMKCWRTLCGMMIPDFGCFYSMQNHFWTHEASLRLWASPLFVALFIMYLFLCL